MDKGEGTPSPLVSLPIFSLAFFDREWHEIKKVQGGEGSPSSLDVKVQGGG